MGARAYAAAAAAAALLGCSAGDSTSADAAPDGPGGPDATLDAAPPPPDTGPPDSCPGPPADPVKAIYSAVDPTRLLAHLKESSGVVPITLPDAGTVSISNRYSPAAKALFRAYFEQQMTRLGISWQEMPYTTKHSNGETYGHNVEAVLPGASKDSIVVIIHYDSMGPSNDPTINPGVDDDMTGMASLFEAAELFSQPCITRQKTIRFVATDYEEWINPGLEGARVYAKYIKAKAMSEGFALVAAIDYEQSGWNCASDSLCSPDAGGKIYDVFDCSGDSANYMSTALGNALIALTGAVGSPLAPEHHCLAQNSDHYAMWEIGVPSVVTSEHIPLSNPHFDYKGGDTFSTIDVAYHLEIARVSIAFTAQLAGVWK